RRAVPRRGGRVDAGLLHVGEAMAVGRHHANVGAEQTKEGSVERVAALLLRDRKDRPSNERSKHLGRNAILRFRPLGNGWEVLLRLADDLEARAVALDRHPLVRLLPHVKGRIGQTAYDVEELAGA